MASVQCSDLKRDASGSDQTYLSPRSTKRPRVGRSNGYPPSKFTSDMSSMACSRAGSRSPMSFSDCYTGSPSPSANPHHEPNTEHLPQYLRKLSATPNPDAHLDDIASDVCLGMLECDAEITDVTAAQSLTPSLPWFEESGTASHINLQTRLLPAPNPAIEISSEPEGTALGTVQLPPIQWLMQHLSVRVQAVCSFPPSLTTSKTRRRSKPPTTILQIWLNLYCPPQKAEICGDFLSKSNMFLQHPEYPEPGLLYQNPQVMSPEFSIITKCEPQGGLTHLGVTEESQVSKLGELDAIDTLNLFRGLDGGDSLSGPPVDSRIRTTLMEHQKKALRFFTQREKCEGSGYNDHPMADAAHTRGGILADSMGFGKTLSAIALIMSTVDESRTTSSGFLRGGTLIITPVSTLGNWEKQLEEHLIPGCVSSLIYHGKMRPADPIVVCQYDIVITTLSVVLESVKRTNDPLRSIRFFRIILDEAHDIRTTTSKRFNAVCALSGERKWALTGTPIQNRMEDLAALFGFIGYSPLGTPALMQEMLRDDDSQGLSGLEKLRGALGILCLRRSHAIVNLDLPKREETVVAIPFSPDERQFYDQIAGTGQKVVTHLLNPLTRIHHLRMICNYGCELPEKASGPDAAAAKCSLCKQTGDSVNQLEGSGCPHRQLCALCIEDIRVIGLGECSVCAMEEVTTPDAMDIDFEPAGHGQTFTYLGQSTKVRELIKNIFSDMNAADRPKHIVFSVWTHMLDRIGTALDNFGIHFRRLDGSMPPKQRNAALREFSEDPSITAILISLKAGGIGINLTAASRVHMMEPHWNPMVELQAIDRAYRIGQKRDVLIRRYIIRGTIEEDMLRIQRKKIMLAKDSLDAGASHIEKWDIRKELVAELRGKETTNC